MEKPEKDPKEIMEKPEKGPKEIEAGTGNMEEKCQKCRWKAAVLILCVVGLLKEFRPSGPFFVDYAVDYRNFTLEQVTFEVIPFTTISYMVSLVLLIIVTDALCYKPMIVTGSLWAIVTWSITIWYYNTVGQARLRQFTYGFSAVATDVAYFTYMYANIEKKDYKRVTSYTHAAGHMGQFISGFLGQAIHSFHLLGIDQMNYLSLGGAIGGFVTSLFLPRVFREFVTDGCRNKRLPWKKDAKETEGMTKPDEKAKEAEVTAEEKGMVTTPEGLDYSRASNRTKSKLQKWKEAPRLAKENFIYAYTNKRVIKWTLWWAFAYGLYIQVDLYIESLWKEIEHHSHQHLFNGAIHGSHAILSVGLALLVGHSKLCWVTWGSLIFGLGTIAQAVALGLMAYTHDLYVAYACFIVFQTGFEVLVIIAKTQVAESVAANSEAFIFGMNTLFAVLVHFLMSVAVGGKTGWPIRDQFIFYAGYAAVLALFMLFCAVPKPERCTRKGSWTLVKMKGRKVQGSPEPDGAKEEMDVTPSMPYSIPREH